MKKPAIALLLFLCSIYSIYAKSHHKSAKRRKALRRKQLKMLINETEKRGLFLASFVGDVYLAVSKDKKLVARERKEDANLFTVNLRSSWWFRTDKDAVLLQPWVKGKKHVITYNALGNAINVELPIRFGYRSKSDATVFTEVIGHNAEHPVYIIRSKYRNRCITLDPNIREYHLKPCSSGGNDLQTFRFLTYEEAKKMEARKNRSTVFDMANFMSNTRVPRGTIFVADKNGVLFKD